MEKIEQALNLAQAEIRALYKKVGYSDSSVLTLIDEALEQVKTCNKPAVMFSEERAKVCKDNETWKRCLVWAKDSRCLKGCPLHLQT